MWSHFGILSASIILDNQFKILSCRTQPPWIIPQICFTRSYPKPITKYLYLMEASGLGKKEGLPEIIAWNNKTFLKNKTTLVPISWHFFCVGIERYLGFWWFCGLVIFIFASVYRIQLCPSWIWEVFLFSDLKKHPKHVIPICLKFSSGKFQTTEVLFHFFFWLVLFIHAGLKEWLSSTTTSFKGRLLIFFVTGGFFLCNIFKVRQI